MPGHRRKRRPAWMHEHRDWIIYGISPAAKSAFTWKTWVAKMQSAPASIYVGMTSRSMSTRLREHRKMAAKGSRCPLHSAMATRKSPWYIFELATKPGATYETAREAEQDIKRRIRALPGAELLNRLTLQCP